MQGYAECGDVHLYYEIAGSGPAVLLLHGNGENLRIFDDILPLLTPYCRVIALDTRGHGQSARGDQPLCFETLARDVLLVMDALDLSTAHIVGYSDGASTAMHLALLAPERVDSLVLLGANHTPQGICLRYQLPIVLGYLVCSVIAAFDRKAVAKRELLGLMVNHPRLSIEQMQQIDVPTLVVVGERDLIRPAHTAEIVHAIPNAQLLTLSGEDHFSLPHSALLWQRVLDFWNYE